MNLHVVAYPELKTEDYDLIQQCRREHNSLYTIIDPHFTLVFSVVAMEAEEFIQEVSLQLSGVAAIPFCLRAAVINKDSFSNNYDAFLVPDEGFGKIVKLHDKLYSQLLVPHHRFDISYIPHISVANATDPQKIKQLVCKWNEQELAIHGTIASVDIINYHNRVITTIEKIDLLSHRL